GWAEKITSNYLRDFIPKKTESPSETRSERVNLIILILMPLLLYLFFFCVPIAKGVAGPAYVLYCICYGIHLILRTERKYLQEPRTYYILLLIFLMSGAMSLFYTSDFISGLKTLKTQSGLVWIPVLIETVSSRDHVRRYLYAYVGGGTILSLIGIYE